jgi:arylsulfatase A-like enzyme
MSETNGMPRSWRSNLVWGALWGMIAWQVYGVVEYAATTLAPLVVYRPMVIAAWHWKLSLLLFGFYTLAGIVTGGFAAFLFTALKRGESKKAQLKTIGTLTLVLAFIANLIAGAPEPATLTFSAIVAAILIWSLWSEARAERFALVASPWATAVFLLLTAWLNNEALARHSLLLRCFCSLVIAGVFVGMSGLGIRAQVRYFRTAPLAQPLTVLGGALAFVLGCAFFFGSNIHAQGDSRRSVAADSSKPNVLLLTLDTVRADHLSLYGYQRNTTPHLAELSREATVFSHATAAGDMTITSHAAILTGTYASWNGARPHQSASGNGVPLSDKYPTLAEILSEHGYSTAAVVANSGFLTREWGFDRGFQFFDARGAVRMMPPRKEYLLRYGVRPVLHRVIDTADFDMMFLRAGEINREAYGLLDRLRSSRRPFFLFLNYMDAHSPYAPPPQFDQLYPAERDLSIPDARYGELFDQLAEGRGQMSEKERQHYISQYDGGIAYMDAEIGRLIDGLKQRGLYENTLLIIVSDHGEAFGERNLVGHGLSVNEDQVDVPLIVKYPGNNRGQRVEERVDHTDLLPTVLDVTGISPPQFLQGFSLRGGVGNANRKLISESFPGSGLISLNSKFNRIERAIYSGNFKYIDSTAGKHELYDVSTDPAEVHNLCSVDAVPCSSMRHDLEEWEKATPKTVSHGKPLDPQTLERLRSLGYAAR